jgi:predicted lipid-binding transport protein (Tim44 family)
MGDTRKTEETPEYGQYAGFGGGLLCLSLMCMGLIGSLIVATMGAIALLFGLRIIKKDA